MLLPSGPVKPGGRTGDAAAYMGRGQLRMHGRQAQPPRRISHVVSVIRNVGRRQVQTLVVRLSQLGQYEIAAWHSIQCKTEER